MCTLFTTLALHVRTIHSSVLVMTEEVTHTLTLVSVPMLASPTYSVSMTHKHSTV